MLARGWDRAIADGRRLGGFFCTATAVVPALLVWHSSVVYSGVRGEDWTGILHRMQCACHQNHRHALSRPDGSHCTIFSPKSLLIYLSVQSY